jgi:hypothetical protein
MSHYNDLSWKKQLYPHLHIEERYQINYLVRVAI